jgi:hypothetical protein
LQVPFSAPIFSSLGVDGNGGASPFSIDSTGSAGFASLDLIPVDIDMVLDFSIDFAEKFSDDAVLSSDDAGSAGSAGFALVFPLTLASSSGFLSILFVGLVKVAMVD